MSTRRTSDAALTTIGVLCFAVLPSTSYLLDAPSAYQSRVDAMHSAMDAEQAAQRQARFEQAAQAMCGGENAAWELLGDGSVQCKTKRGHKTITAQVQP